MRTDQNEISKGVLTYTEIINNDVKEMRQIINFFKNSKNIDFEFKDEDRNIVEIKYHLDKNIIYLKKRGKLNYEAVHIVKKETEIKIKMDYTEYKNEYNSRIFTEDISFKENQNGFEIALMYKIEDQKFKTIFKIERK